MQVFALEFSGVMRHVCMDDIAMHVSTLKQIATLVSSSYKSCKTFHQLMKLVCVQSIASQ